MAIDGLTTLTSVLQTDTSGTAAASVRSARASVGPYAANVAPAAAHDYEIENRAAGTYAGLVNPKKGIDPMDDEAESYPYYVEEEEEKETEQEEEDLFDWDELEDEEWDEDEEDDMADYLTFKQEKGMFVDIQA